MDWTLPDDDFRPPHDWRRFVVPAMVAVAVNSAVLALWHIKCPWKERAGD
jgi:hypothetical protein